MADSKTQEEKEYEKLNRLSNHAYSQCKSVGFYDDAGNAPESGRGKTISEKINAPDTWTSKAADDQAEYTKKGGRCARGCLYGRTCNAKSGSCCEETSVIRPMTNYPIREGALGW